MDEDVDGIEIISRVEPGMCGGTSATRDTKAPKTIISEEMTLFNVTSSFSGCAPGPGTVLDFIPLGYLSAFAAKADKGYLLCLETAEGTGYHPRHDISFALVKNDIFPALVALVKKHDLAKNNGFNAFTHGLPENFGGSVDIRYASGERIYFSDNRSPILAPKAAREIADVFTEAMKGDKAELPDIEGLKEIIFDEKRKDGGFTKARLAIRPDGTGINHKQSKYDGPKVYESEKEVDADTVEVIKRNITDCGVLAREGLPSNGFSLGNEKSLAFIFDGGERIEVRDDRIVPGCLGRAFFNIELEMTVKH